MLLAVSWLVDTRVTITILICVKSFFLCHFFQFFFTALDWLLWLIYLGTIFSAVFTCDFYLHSVFFNWWIFFWTGIAFFYLSVKQSTLPFTLLNFLSTFLNGSSTLSLKLALLLVNVLIFIGNLINGLIKQLFF